MAPNWHFFAQKRENNTSLPRGALPGGYTQEHKEPATKCTLRLYSVSCQIKVPSIREFIHYLVIKLGRLFRFHSATTDYIVCLFPTNLTLFPSKFTEKCTSAMSFEKKKKKRNFTYSRNIVRVQTPSKLLHLDIKGFIPKYLTAPLQA